MGFEIGKVSYRTHISDNVLEMRFNGEKLEPGMSIPKTSVIDLIVGDQSLNRFQEEDTNTRSEEHTSELQSRPHLVCRLLLEKKKKKTKKKTKKKKKKAETRLEQNTVKKI